MRRTRQERIGPFRNGFGAFSILGFFSCVQRQIKYFPHSSGKDLDGKPERPAGALLRLLRLHRHLNAQPGLDLDDLAGVRGLEGVRQRQDHIASSLNRASINSLLSKRDIFKRYVLLLRVEVGSDRRRRWRRSTPRTRSRGSRDARNLLNSQLYSFPHLINNGMNPFHIIVLHAVKHQG